MSAGRPRAHSNARSELIRAARSLFAREPYAKVSIRSLAREAGVNSALISYYFKDKAGLFEAMLRETVAPVLQQFDRIPEHPSAESLLELMQTYYRTAGQTPELPRLIMRLLMEHGSGVDHKVVASMAQLFNAKARAIFSAFATAGLLKAEIPQEMARLSFMSLMIGPFLLPPAVLKLQNIELTPEFLAALAQHNINLLSAGLFSPDAPSVQEKHL